MSEKIRLSILLDTGGAAGKSNERAVADAIANSVAAGVVKANRHLARLGTGLGGSGSAGTTGGIHPGGGFGAINTQLATTNRLLGQVHRGTMGWGRAITYSLASAASSIYVLRSGLQGIRALLVDPAFRSFKLFSDISDNSRRFEIAMSRVSGGMDRARQLNRRLMTSDSPLNTTQLREAAQALAFTPALSRRIAASDPATAARETERFGGLLQRLGMVDPAQGTQGALIGVREAMEGDLQSLRRRFGISSRTLARLAQKDLADLTKDPQMVLQAVELWADLFIPEIALEKSQALISVRLEKLRDAGRLAVTKIADAGLYDSISSRLGRTRQRALDYLESPAFDRVAANVSGNVDAVIDNVGLAVRALSRGLTGRESSDSVAAFGDIIDATSGHLRTLSDVLPSVAHGFGAFVRELGTAVELAAQAAGLIDKVSRGGQQTKQALVNGGSGMLGYSLGITGTPEAVARRQALGNLWDQLNPRDVAAGDYRQGKRQLNARLGERTRAIDSMMGVLGDAGMAWDGSSFEARFANPRFAARLLEANGYAEAAEILRRQGGGSGAASMGRSIVPEALMAEVRREQAVPAFANFIQEQGPRLEPLNRLASRESALSRLSSTIGALEAVPGLVDSLRAKRDERGRQISEAIHAGQLATLQHPLDTRLRTHVADAWGGMRKLEAAYDETVKTLADGLLEANTDYASVLSEQLDRMAPHLAATLSEQLSNGTTAFARGVADALAYAGKAVENQVAQLGLASLPLDVQQRVVSSRIGAGLRRIDDSRRMGMIELGMSPDDLSRLRPLSSTAAAAEAVRYIHQNALPAQAELIRRAAGAYAANPADLEAATALGDSQRGYAELVSLMKQLRIESDLTLRAFDDFGKGARQALEGGLGDAINGLISGTGDLRDVVAGFLQDITRAMSNAFAGSLVQGLLGDFGSADKGLTGGGGLLGNFFSGLFGFADGGVIEGGRPVWGGRAMAFADGGIVSGPTAFPLRGGGIGIAGEAGAEAIMPLARMADGQLGVRGGGANVTVNLQVSTPDAGSFRRSKEQIISELTPSIRRALGA